MALGGGCGLARFGWADAWADAGQEGTAASLTETLVYNTANAYQVRAVNRQQ